MAARLWIKKKPQQKSLYLAILAVWDAITNKYHDPFTVRFLKSKLIFENQGDLQSLQGNLHLWPMCNLFAKFH